MGDGAVVKVYVGIGSNVERERSVTGAVRDLRRRYKNVEVSPVYECPAIGFKGSAFLNLVAGFDTSETIEQLNVSMKQIEANHGRRRGAEKFSDRTLDIDVLLVGDTILHEGRIDIPRYEIRRYAFVLKPLVDLIPHGIHPELNKTFAQMWDGFDATQQPLTEYPLEFTQA